ncbi:NAD-binding protein [Serratia ureilytica]
MIQNTVLWSITRAADGLRCTGAGNRILSVCAADPGNDAPGCLVYRTLDDLAAIQACAANGKTGVVVGGGLLGLEAANALKQLGLDTHVVELHRG